MRKQFSFLLLLLSAFVILGTSVSAQIINTVASAAFPTGIFVDHSGNIFFCETGRVRKVSNTGVITTIAGTGVNGFSGDGGQATSAQINGPYGIYEDNSGNIYIGTTLDCRIRKVNTSGVISTFAGNGTSGYSGNGGPATNAAIGAPQTITGDAAGNIYFVDFFNGVARKINTSGIISTIAGTGTPGYSGDGASATAAQLGAPNGISIDATGNVYISDDAPNVVRKINTSGIISTVAGGSNTTGNSGNGGLATSALFGDIENVTSDPVGNLYIIDGKASTVRRVNASTGIINAFAGTGVNGFSGDGGLAVNAQLNSPWAIAKDDSDNFYIADTRNNRIRKVSIVYPLLTSTTSVTQVINQPYLTNIDNNNFQRLLTLTPTEGANMLSGSTDFKVSIDPSIPRYNSQPYVPRHYDITPANNATTAKANIILYFLQSEFDAYNNYVTSNSLNLPLLPSGGTDNGNVKVTQFHGVGTAPGNYTGSAVLINPSVVWNSSNNWWELSFPVIGFSGFYVYTGNSVLPLHLTAFSAQKQNENVVLSWATQNEVNTSFFSIQKSLDAAYFSLAGAVKAADKDGINDYKYIDNISSVTANTVFYRLQMVNKDGKVTYSPVIKVDLKGASVFSVGPNPAKGYLVVNGNVTRFELFDMVGRQVLVKPLNASGTYVDISSLSKGVYIAKARNEVGVFFTQRVVVE
jgi:sugar lactone lactonase YvrE